MTKIDKRKKIASAKTKEIKIPGKTKIISIGTNHAGTSFLRTLAKLDKHKKFDIVTYDQNSNISFLGCGIALWVSGEFKDPNGLFYSDAEQLTAMGVRVNMGHKVLEVNQKGKYIVVENLNTGIVFKDYFDKLVYAAGTWPIVPPFKGVQSKNIFLSKLFQHAEMIKEKANDPKVKNVVIVGAGYIGIELVEAFNLKGKKVTLIDMQDRVIPNYFDKKFTRPLEERMLKKGVKLALGEAVEEFTSNNRGEVDKVITNKGEYKADLVILSIGFKPQTGLIKAQKVKNGAIKVNEFQQALGEEDLYVLGDAAALHHLALNEHASVALATNAVKTGIVAAMHIAGQNISLPGVNGTNGINVFGCKYASTGISEVAAKAMKINVKTEFLVDKDRPEFMRNAEDVAFKIVYDPETLKLLGAQIGTWGQHNHAEIIQTMSLAIQKGMTLPEIALMDVYFLPHYNKPFNFVLQTILNAIGMNYNK